MLLRQERVDEDREEHVQEDREVFVVYGEKNVHRESGG
jgi:hypothetical protein